MSSSPVYERPYASVEFVCKGCGVEYRVDFEFVTGPYAAQEFQHCVNDEPQFLGGPIVAVWEKRRGEWVLVSARKTK
jgi:hypothetical protein